MSEADIPPPGRGATRATVARRAGGWLARGLLVALTSFAGYTAYLSHRYGLTYAAAGGALLRHSATLAIWATCRIYDPADPIVAGTGPDLDAVPEAAGYARIEEVLDGRGRADAAPGVRLLGREVRNERIVRGAFRFSYQPYDEPRLHRLRRKYRLDDVVAGAADDFEALVRLRDWARSRFRRRDYQPLMRDFDALAILDRDLRNDAGRELDLAREYDPCHFFPLLFCQVAVSMGLQARVTGITSHGMAEAWSDEYRKWVAFDAELNLHFEKRGVPLGLLELHAEARRPGPTEVRIVPGAQWSGDPSPTLAFLGVDRIDPDEWIRLFKYVSIAEMRNDWMTNGYFPGHPARGDLATLIYEDPGVPGRYEFLGALRPRTGRAADFNWTLNQAEILARGGPEAGTLHLAFRTVTPNFAAFEVTLDESRRVEVPGATFDWELHEGTNRLAVRPVNKFGVRGIASSVRLEVAPASGWARLVTDTAPSGGGLR